MKNKTANFLKLGTLLLGFSLLLWNCKQEELIVLESIENQNIKIGDYTVENSSLSALNKDSDFTFLVKELSMQRLFESINTQSKGNSSEFTDVYGKCFTIASDKVRKVAKENYTSYTFLIKREERKEGYENLIIENNSKGQNSYIIHYKKSTDGEFKPKYQIPVTETITQLKNTESKGSCFQITVIVATHCTCTVHSDTSSSSCDCHGKETVYDYYTSTYCSGGGESTGTGDYGNLFDNNYGDPSLGGGGVSDTNNETPSATALVSYNEDLVLIKHRLDNNTYFLETVADYNVYISDISKYLTSTIYNVFPKLYENIQAIINSNNLSLNDLKSLSDYLFNIYTITNNYTIDGNTVLSSFSNEDQQIIIFVNGQIELGTIADKFSETDPIKITLNYNPGKINGRDDQKYTHIASDGARVYYKMEDGSIVIASPTELSLNSNGNLASKFTSESGNDKYYYIKPIGSSEWSNYLIKQASSTSDDLRIIFELGIQELAKVLGTYVVPVEDIKILIDGKDFAGQPTSRWLAAGLLVVEIIPGGKLLKAVKVIPTSVFNGTGKFLKAIAKTNGGTTKLVFDAVNGVIDFGRRGQLAEVIGTVGTGLHAHHLIPWTQKSQELVQNAAKASKHFHLNEAQNGIPRPTSLHLSGHQHYNNAVREILENNNNITNPNDAYNFIIGFTEHIRDLIIANPTLNSGQIADLITYPN